MSNLVRYCCLIGGIAVCWTQLAHPLTAAESRVEFTRDIQPILTNHCLACHGPDSASREAGLRLDQREAAVEAMAIVPGEPEASELVDRIQRGDDDDMAMPPIDGHKRLLAAEKELLITWIRQGAEYEAHWSLIPPTKPSLPEVQTSDWVENPIDQFVLAKLEAEGLSPAPQADRHTLARRLALDLTGLPPTPQQVARFVDDPSPDYYLNYVNRLLDSPQWGEHRGRFWLDYARYADTHGIHFDNFREIWAYRNWVINAFNQNQPFDQFSIEQLAGDLLPNPSLDQLIATGFNRCNITTNEGGIIDEEYKVLYARDRTETTSAVWLGLTTGCAVCHDHKFDPITAKDFYAFSAFFNNTTQPVRDQNIPNTPPVIPVPQVQDRERWQRLPSEIAAAETELSEAKEAARGEFAAAQSSLAAAEILATVKRDDLLLHAPLAAGKGRVAQVLRKGVLSPQVADNELKWSAGQTSAFALEVSAESTLAFPRDGDFERDQAFSVSAWLWLPADNLGGAVLARMDEGNDFRGWDLWLENGRLGSHIIHAWPDNALKVVCQDPLPKQRWTHVVVSYDGSAKQAGLKFFIDGRECTSRNIQKDNLTDTIRTAVPLKLGSRSGGAKVPGIKLNDLRLYSNSLDAAVATQLNRATRAAYLAAIPTGQLAEPDREALFDWWLVDHAPAYSAAKTMRDQLVAEKQAIEQRGTIAHIMNEQDGPAIAYLLARGEYDQRGDQVSADTPAVLPPMPDDFPKNRLGLARWLFLNEHPLTARVTVNRFWQEVFGRGLVESAGDFGITGGTPSHPELLDYLAVHFRESGWDVKGLFRLIVTSATYRQAAIATPEKIELDATNILFSRGPRYRMDAEMVRDSALAVSGLLSPKIGGPSVRPYQPEGVWEAVAMPGSNTRDYVTDQGASLYRRSMYTFWKRSAPPASMDILNAPSRETCTVSRERTNTPLQALVTLNDPQFIEAARHMATNVLTNFPNDKARFDEIALRLLARPLQAAETEVIEQSLARLRTHYREHPEDAKALVQIGQTPTPETLAVDELAAWTMLCNQLLNLDEMLNK
ncbi:DUF1553 domain-containing protein [Planctomycetaceae bacterium SH139]